jgi:predicted DNA-binding transcriptional regulator YafY
MRAERLLRLMFLLRAHGKLTTRTLATRLGVSTRTVQRDLDALSLAGVPVYAERGRGGGWSLAADYRTRLDGLTPAETMAVFVGTAGRVVADLGLAADAESGFDKLLATVPDHARRQAEYARTRVLVDHTGWLPVGDAPARLGMLQEALWQDQRVRITYRGHDRTVAPLGLVAKGDRWYLVASRQDGEIRTYLVSRVAHAEPTGQRFTRPPGFDLATYWRESNERFFASLRDYPVRLRVRTSMVHRLSWAPNAAVERVVDLGDGWSEVSATFEKAYETRAWLLGLAGDLVVLAPAELREAVTAAARALLAQRLRPAPAPPPG